MIFSYNLKKLCISYFTCSVFKSALTYEWDSSGNSHIHKVHKDVHNQRISYVLETLCCSSKQRPWYTFCIHKIQQTLGYFMSSDHFQSDCGNSGLTEIKVQYEGSLHTMEDFSACRHLRSHMILINSWPEWGQKMDGHQCWALKKIVLM